MKNIFYLPVFAVLILTLSVATIPDAHAGRSFDLGKGTCVHLLGGIWNPATSTCTIIGSSTLKAGVSMNIPSAVALRINSTGTFTNSGIITISNTGGLGLFNSGGTITNSGTITLSNTGGTGIFNSVGSTIDNTSGKICDVNNDPSTLPGTAAGTVPTSGNAIGVGC